PVIICTPEYTKIAGIAEHFNLLYAGSLQPIAGKRITDVNILQPDYIALCDQGFRIEIGRPTQVCGGAFCWHLRMHFVARLLPALKIIHVINITVFLPRCQRWPSRSEEHTSEL